MAAVMAEKEIDEAEIAKHYADQEGTLVETATGRDEYVASIRSDDYAEVSRG